MSEDLAKQLRTIAEEAPKLREAGVFGRVKAGDVEFNLAETPAEATQSVEDDDDPLNDPATYGFRRGGKIPTLGGGS